MSETADQEPKTATFADVLQRISDAEPIDALMMFFNGKIVAADRELAELYKTLRGGKEAPEDTQKRTDMYGALANYLHESKSDGHRHTVKRFTALYLDYIAFCVVIGKVVELAHASSGSTPAESTEPPASDVQQPAQGTSSAEEKAEPEEKQCPTPPESESAEPDHSGGGAVAPRRSRRLRASAAEKK